MVEVGACPCIIIIGIHPSSALLPESLVSLHGRQDGVQGGGRRQAGQSSRQECRAAWPEKQECLWLEDMKQDETDSAAGRAGGQTGSQEGSSAGDGFSTLGSAWSAGKREPGLTCSHSFLTVFGPNVNIRLPGALAEA